MVRILLADDHAIIRNGLKIIICNYLGNAAIDEAWDGASVSHLVGQHDYDLIILDIRMPDTNASFLVTEIITLKPKAKILIFSINNEEIYARRFLQIGAMGYLSKGSPETEVVKAIDNVLNNRKYVSPSLLQNMSCDIKNDRYSNPFSRLSRRELQILEPLIKGETISQISVMLDVEPSTAGTYKSRILKKLKCNNLQDVRALAKVYNVVIG
jgi:DNA-binding NarL/FixJ family response regulator